MPTRFGLLLSIALLGMLLGSLNYNNNLGLLFTFMVTGIVLISAFQTQACLQQFRFSHLHAKPVFAGDIMYIYIQSKSPLQSDAIYCCSSEKTPAHNKRRLCTMGGPLQVAYETSTRGLRSCPAVRVSCDYPYGIFSAWTWIFPDATLLVYPRPEINPPAWKGLAESEDGLPGLLGQEDFSYIRNYQVGDPMKNVSWKHSAKSGSLKTRVFEDRQSASSDIRLEHTGLNNIEKALSRMAAWVLQADKTGQNYSLHLQGVRIGPDRGKSHLDRCLSALARFGSGNEK